MAWTTITKTDSQHDTGKPITKDLFIDPVIDNLNDLNDRVGANAGVLNGSFEEGTVGTGNTPSSWSWTASGSGGTYALTSTSGEQAHGQNGFKITHPSGVGNGGGYIQTDEFIPVGTSDYLYLAWKMKVSAANGAENTVTILWYKKDQTVSGVTTSNDIFNSTAGPTAWTQCFSGAQVPSDACFFKVRLLGGDTATDPGSSTDIFFDDVRIVKEPGDVFSKNVSFDVAGSPNWVSPSAIRCIWVECIGGGGGGGGSANWGGGGGGEYAAGYFMTATSTAYACVVGAAASNSTFNSTTVVANGGTTATNTTGGAGGTGGTGEITFDGLAGQNNGGSGGYAPNGGGGGAGGGSSTDGSSPGGGGGGDTTSRNGAAGRVRIWFN